MLKFIIRFPFILCAFAVSAKAGPYYDLSLHTSSATMKVSGAVKIAASSSTPNTPVITLDGANSLATIPEVHSAKSGPMLSWETGGATQSGLQGLFNFGYTSGFTIYDYQTPGNGRLGLGTPYGPQIYGKGYVGTPFLGINNPNPVHALDVFGGAKFTSTVTAFGFYGSGAGLTNIPGSAVDTSTITTYVQSYTAGIVAPINAALSTAAYVNKAQTFSGVNTFVSSLTAAGGFSTTSSTHTEICLDGVCRTAWPSEGVNLFFTNAPSTYTPYLLLSTANPAGQASTTTVLASASDIIISTFVYPGFGATFIEAGIIDFHTHISVSATAGAKVARVYYKMFRSSGTIGSQEVVISTSEVSNPATTAVEGVELHASIGDTAWTPGDSLIVRGYTSVSGTGVDPTLSVYRAGIYQSHVSLPGSDAFFGSGTGGGTTVVGGGTGFVKGYFYSETNGVQTQFTLPSVPLTNSLNLAKNGTTLIVPNDYTLSNAVITMNTAPVSSTTLTYHYAIADSTVGITTSTNTWSAAQTFMGAVSLPTRDKITFGNQVIQSTAGVLGAFTSNNTTFGACVTGSTRSITTNGGPLFIGMSGTWSNSGIGGTNYASVLVDGVAVQGEAGLSVITVPTTAVFGFNFNWITPPLSAGVHNVCLVIRTTANSYTLQYGANTVSNQFFVMELR